MNTNFFSLHKRNWLSSIWYQKVGRTRSSIYSDLSFENAFAKWIDFAAFIHCLELDLLIATKNTKEKDAIHWRNKLHSQYDVVKVRIERFFLLILFQTICNEWDVCHSRKYTCGYRYLHGWQNACHGFVDMTLAFMQ